MASFQKRGKTWTARISYTDTYGERKYKTKSGFRIKSAAEEWALTIEQGKFDESIGKANTTESFADYFWNWYKTYKEPILSLATKRRYVITYNEVKDYFGVLKLAAITRESYQVFLNEYGKTRAIASSKKLNTQIRACVRDAVDEGALTRDFTKKATITGHAGKMPL